MGLFRTSDSIVSQAMPLTAAMIASIDQRPAWLFENQSGTLGTNLNSSVIYCGAMAADSTISVILPGVASKSVSAFTLTSGGSGYQESGSANIATTVSPSPGSGLTVDITVPVPTTNALTPGTGYSVGAFTVTGGTAGASGLSGTIDSFTGGGANGPIATFTILDGGQGYTAADILTIVQGANDDARITLATAPNGAVTAAVIGNSAGLNYSIGDVITIAQAGSGLNATLTVTDILLKPLSSQAITFAGLQPGSILPVAVDYVTAVSGTGMTVANFIVGR